MFKKRDIKFFANADYILNQINSIFIFKYIFTIIKNAMYFNSIK